MMLFSLLYGVIFKLMILAGSTTSNQNPILLYAKILEDKCANFEVFDHGSNFQYYKTAVTKRDETAFYYSDEDRQEVIIQKKDVEGNFVLKYVFIAHKNTYEIILKSCPEHLAENKKELYGLQQKLYNKQNL